jgi:hypothetical protein
VSVPGGAAGAGNAYVILGSNTPKMRVQTLNAAAPFLGLSTNWDLATGTQDDVTKQSWGLMLRHDNDTLQVSRKPAGAAQANLLTLDNAGNLTITGKLFPAGITYRASAGTSFRYAASSNISTTALTRILGSASITTSGGLVLVCVNLDGRFYPINTGIQFLAIEVQRSGTNITDWVTEYEIPSGSFNHGFGVGGLFPILDKPAAGTYTYDVYVRVPTTSQIYRTGSYTSSTIQVYEFG